MKKWNNKTNIFYLIISILTVTSCSKKDNLSNEIEMKQAYLSRFFGLSEADQDSTNYRLTEEDINDQIPFVKEGLRSRGFRFVSDSLFAARLKEIFKIDVHALQNNPRVVNHLKFHTLLNNYDALLGTEYVRKGWTPSERLGKRKVYNQEHELQETARSKSENIILVIDSGFIMPALAPIRFMDKEKNKYKLSLPDYIYHRNQFIFYDNKASLRWLINNDIDFLVELYRDFGYESDLTLNKAVIDCISYSDRYAYDDFDLFFLKFDDNKNITIRENIMKQIADSTNDLSYYGPVQVLRGLAFSHMEGSAMDIKISAYAGYYTEIVYEKLLPKFDPGENWNCCRESFFEDLIIDRPDFGYYKKYLAVVKKNNYYGLPGLKEMINKY